MGFLTTLVSKLSSKAILILMGALLALVLTLWWTNDRQADELEGLRQTLSDQVSLNQRLSEQNTDLADEVLKQPARIVEVVKTVEKEVCDGKVLYEKVINLPGKTEVTNEGDAVDLDGRLPDDLIKLLK